MRFRPAKQHDLDAIVSLAVESVSRDPLPVVIDLPAMREKALSLMGKPQHFVWVGVNDKGEVVSSVAAESYAGFWFKREQCSVLLFYGRETGSVVPLIIRFASWVKSRPIIKLGVFELEPWMDERLEQLLIKLGFSRKSTNLTYVRN